ncbi:MAG: DUF2244 domain-containing protein [Pseudomonadota bacterium]
MAVQDNVVGSVAPTAPFPGGQDWRARQDRPVWEATLWPNRSLNATGQRQVMLLIAVGLSIPLLPALGTPVFWGLLPFTLGAWGAMWLGFRRSNRALTLRETVTLWRDEMRVERHEPSGAVLRWRADPWHVRVQVHDCARVESYLTLKGAGREIELGAFLCPSERVSLAAELEGALTHAVTGRPPLSP